MTGIPEGTWQARRVRRGRLTHARLKGSAFALCGAKYAYASPYTSHDFCSKCQKMLKTLGLELRLTRSPKYKIPTVGVLPIVGLRG